jgi:hypothetical protein
MEKYVGRVEHARENDGDRINHAMEKIGVHARGGGGKKKNGGGGNNVM